MDDKSPIEKLDESLYSRDYKEPRDVRSPIGGQDLPDTEEKWHSPDLDEMLRDRRQEAYRPTKLKKFFIFSLVAFVAALGVAAYVYFAGGNFISSKNVDIKITGPSAIAAGAPLELSVAVDNGNNADLEGAKLSIQYPDGTRAADDSTKPLPRDQANIGVIKAGGESIETFRSALYGEKGTVLTLKLSLEYKVKGSGATFYKDKTYDVALGDTPVTLGVTNPSSVTSGAPYTMTIVVASNAADVIKNVLVKAEYPYGFTPSSADPSFSTPDKNLWTLGDLAPGDKKTITLHGTLTGVDGDERTFRFYSGEADPGTPTTMQTPLVSTSETIGINRPSVELAIAVGGEQSDSYIAPAGASVTVTVRYQNNDPDKLTNAALSVRLVGSSLDKFSIRPQDGGFYDSNTGLITWAAPQAASLSVLAPGDSGQISFSFASVKNPPAGNQAIDIQAGFVGTPPAGGDTVRSADEASVKITSKVDLSGKALYSRGPFVNSGPIPPKAGATTTYSIILDLANTQNQVSDGKVTMRLGPNVTFMPGNAGAEPVSYDEGSNTVTWTVGDLASGAGVSAPAREAYFQVALRPSIGQIGTAPALVQAVSFSGTDSFTHLPVSDSLDSITTRLTSDPKYVQGDEKVVK